MLSYRKSKQGWAAFGPAAELKVGPVTVRRAKDGQLVAETIERVSRPFDVDGVPHAYGYLLRRANGTPAPAPALPPSGSTVGYRLTDEQQACVDLFVEGKTYKVQAYAGTGKTSVLKAMAEARRDKSGRYIAFNKAIVVEAKGKMPSNVTVTTAHAMALAYTPEPFKARFRLPRDAKLVGPGKWMELARRLRLEPVDFRLGEQVITYRPAKLASVVMKALNTFCQSGDPEPNRHHFEAIDAIEAEGDTMGTNNRVMQEALLPVLRFAWADLSDPDGRLLTYDHAHYLKHFELSGVSLGEGFVLVDEAQDLSPVLLSIIETQILHGIQTVLVGDTFQSIYSFTGAVNAMELAPIETTLHLTKSFRFGQNIAAEANKVLDYLGAELPLVGNEAITDRVGRESDPTTVLTRSNAAAVSELLDEIKAGGKPLLIGSVEEITKLVEACRDIIEGKGTEHPELSWATSWREVQAHAAEEEDAELKLWVDLIEGFGIEPLVDALAHMPAHEDKATRVISTTHKVKGLEWETVRLHGGLGWCNELRPLEPEQARLLYVAVTRAQQALDISAVRFFREVA